MVSTGNAVARSIASAVRKVPGLIGQFNSKSHRSLQSNNHTSHGQRDWRSLGHKAGTQGLQRFGCFPSYLYSMQEESYCKWYAIGVLVMVWTLHTLYLDLILKVSISPVVLGVERGWDDPLWLCEYTLHCPIVQPETEVLVRTIRCEVEPDFISHAVILQPWFTERVAANHYKMCQQLVTSIGQLVLNRLVTSIGQLVLNRLVTSIGQPVLNRLVTSIGVEKSLYIPRGMSMTTC